MVFNLDALGQFQQTRDTISLLESLPYIEREFVDPTPSSIPLMELEDHPDVHFVRYSNLEHLAEVRDITIHEAATVVQKANLLPSRRFVVAMEEWRPLINPSIIDEFPNVLLIKEVNTPTYHFCETCMNAFMETRDDRYIDLFLEAPEVLLEYTEDQLNKYIAVLMKQNPNLTHNQAYDQAKYRLQAFDKKDSAMSSMKKSAENGVQYAAEINRQTDKALGREPKQPAETSQQAQSTAQPATNTGGDQQGWWARKWTAFKNWMNNLGSNGDQKSTWFTNMVTKVKNFFNGNAQAAQSTNQQQTKQSQATNQSQQPNQPAEPQGTAAEQITNQVVQKGANKAGEMVDSAKSKIDQAFGDDLGIDVSNITSGLADQAKELINTNSGKIASQASDVVQKGVDAAVSTGKKAVEKVKNATKPTNEGKTTVTTREVSENEVPTWAKNKIG